MMTLPQEVSVNVASPQSVSHVAARHSQACAVSLTAMRAQSPSRTEKEQEKRAAMEAQYAAWQAKYPSALTHFADLIELAKGKQIAVFLDYDGTLSPIVEHPDKAFMSETMRAAVKTVAQHFPTAIISGRGREKVYDFVQLKELYYAGSHGMDIKGPAQVQNGKARSVLETAPNGTVSTGTDEKGNDVVFFQPASEYYPIMNEVFEILREQTASIENTYVENNKFCISVHFRRVAEEKWDELAGTVNRVLDGYPQLQITHGRKVLEVRPKVNWNKGKALSYLLQALGLERGEEVVPVYIGDDRTDEDAFGVLKERKIGCGIVVSTIAKVTSASYSLRDPSEVMAFLHQLVRWKDAQLERQ